MARKKNRNIFSLKITIVIVTILAVIYSIFWFFIAKEINNLAKNINYETGNWKISYEKAKISGFPFHFKLKINNANITYHNKVTNLKIVSLLNNLEAKTNATFNKIEFTLPKDIFVDTYFDQKYKKWNFSTKYRPYIKISEAGIINTFKIIELIYDPERFNEQKYNLDELQYFYKELNCIDLVANKTLITTNADTQIKLKNITDSFNLALKTNSDINFTDAEYIGHNFKTLNYKTDIFLKINKENNSYTSISLLDIKLLKLSLDKHFISLSGKIDNNNNDKTTNLSLKIEEWDSLLKSLEADHIISLEKKHILENMMQDITGKEYNNNIETSIYTTKEGNVRIGKAEIGFINGYIKQFMTSN
jgi:hypothetical protein